MKTSPMLMLVEHTPLTFPRSSGLVVFSQTHSELYSNQIFCVTYMFMTHHFSTSVETQTLRIQGYTKRLIPRNYHTLIHSHSLRWRSLMFLLTLATRTQTTITGIVSEKVSQERLAAGPSGMQSSRICHSAKTTHNSG